MIQRLPVVADERGRDAQRLTVRAAHQERRAGRIPRRVAARLERRAQAARGKRARIGLALNELGARERLDEPPVVVPGDERVVLFRGRPGHRLEPVGKVRRAVLQGPVLHRLGDDVGDLGTQAFAFADGLAQGAKGLFGQALLHGAPAERVAAEVAADFCLIQSRHRDGAVIVRHRNFLLALYSEARPLDGRLDYAPRQAAPGSCITVFLPRRAGLAARRELGRGGRGVWPVLAGAGRCWPVRRGLTHPRPLGRLRSARLRRRGARPGNFTPSAPDLGPPAA